MTTQYAAEFLVSIPMGTPPEDKFYVQASVIRAIDETQRVKHHTASTVAPGVWSVRVNFLATDVLEARAIVNRAAAETGYPTDVVLR